MAFVAKLRNGIFRNTGACFSPVNAYLNLIGIETLGPVSYTHLDVYKRQGFIRRGKKKILFLCDSYSYSASKKMAGYEAALRDAGYPIRGELKFYTKNRIHHVRDMLLSHKNLEFDSVVATDDGLAIGALKYANVKGLKVPDDIEIAGYNNSQLSVGCEPELTSVDNHLEKMCNDTVDYMLRVLQGDTDVPPQNEVVCEIKKRCTTDF